MTRNLSHLAIIGLAAFCALLLFERNAMGECLSKGAKIHVTAAALYADCGPRAE